MGRIGKGKKDSKVHFCKGKIFSSVSLSQGVVSFIVL